ncbi:NmrA family NAD(P)-binding protein [Dictyobacter alpinus]
MGDRYTDQLVLVLGGTGKTGRRVVEQLRVRGVPTRVGSRAHDPAFDWADQTTWDGVLRDVKSVYVSFYPDLAAPGAVEAVQTFANKAVAHGVRHLVLLSGRGEQEAQLCEQVIQAAGVDWTVVRASWFNQNFSEGMMRETVLSGEVALPVGDMGEPFVDADDIAAVAVAALTEAGHAGQLYEVTGPRLLTFAKAMQEISRFSGRTVRFMTISAEQYASLLREYGVPQEEIAQLIYLFTEVLDGRNAHLTDGVQRALGRPPRDFADFARVAAAAGAWNR